MQHLKNLTTELLVGKKMCLSVLASRLTHERSSLPPMLLLKVPNTKGAFQFHDSQIKISHFETPGTHRHSTEHLQKQTNFKLQAP